MVPDVAIRTLGVPFVSMGNKRMTPVVLAILYKTIEDGAIVTDAVLVANISRHAYYDLIWDSRWRKA